MSSGGEYENTVSIAARYFSSCAGEKMGRSESSSLVRKSGISGVGNLWDMTGRIPVHPRIHGRFYDLVGSVTRNLQLIGKIQ